MTAAITFSPTVPLPLLMAFTAMAAALLVYGGLRRARGIALRAIPMLVLIIALADPILMREHRTPLADVAVVVVDETGSQKLGQRMERTTKAAGKLAAELTTQPDLEVRTVHVTGANQDGTQLFTALNAALDDVPAQRLAGTIMITDGQVHDTPTPSVHAPWQGAPVHVLLTGDRGERDRRIRIERAPDFGLVGQTAAVRVKIEDTGAPPGAEVPVTVRRNGTEPQTLTLPVGGSSDLPVTIANVGANVFEIDVAPRDGELSLANNHALVSVTGVRDRLRVLLISGQPHVGERAWRNLLKSDPNVDLVHFTILRPLTKDDGTPINELALIQFPYTELFEEQLHDFDLVIFDRYSRRGLVPFQFMPKIVDYVRHGGAVMLAVGPEYADSYSLYNSPLQSILPAAPTGQVSEQPFRPQISALGARHPVTAELTGAFANDAGNAPTWGRWLRQVNVGTPSGETVMTGANNEPLLVLDHVGKGRVALLLSDTIWLWGKDFDGGGPQAELLRRVSHWLMKEPELEEESLTAEPHGDDLVITRHSVATDEKSVTVTKPAGGDETVVPQDAGRGRFVAKLTSAAPGLYRMTDGEHTAVAAVGSPNPLENYDVVTTDAKVGPVAEATGGGVYWLGDGDAPAVRRVAPGRTAHGASWVGVKANKQSAVTGVTQVHLAPVALLLAALMAGAMLAWWREGQ
ncbi:MAG: hypothetical protein EPO08_06445 [Rhodospirillaceae bacterium]|nr:MAG: hypothetical protein EPO08_06445 [Rhodospirillaceae bacterium]